MPPCASPEEARLLVFLRGSAHSTAHLSGRGFLSECPPVDSRKSCLIAATCYDFFVTLASS